MIGTIAIKELLFSIKTVRFIVTVLICCLLIPISVWVLSNDYLRDEEDYRDRLALEERRETGKNFLISVNRPIPPLSPLFRGVCPESANSIELKHAVAWNYPVAAATQSVTHDIFPTVDLTFIIGVVVSALALMISFDSISGEKANATLRLMMSNAIPRSKIVIGKWVGLAGALLLPFLVGMLISLLIFFSITGLNLSGDNWLALSLALMVSIIYLILFILIGIVISALTSNPSVSIFLCLGAWGLLTIILPQTAIAVSDVLGPLPTPQQIERDIRVNYNNFANGLRESNRELIEEARREGTPFSELNLATNLNLRDRSIQNRKEANNVEREFWLQIARQERAGKLLSLMSPYGSLAQALVCLADTGPAGQREFLIRSYQYGEQYFEDIWEKAYGDSEAYSSWDDIYASFPEFLYEGTSLESRLQAAMWPIFSLLLANIILLMLGIIAYNRYDVR